MGFRPPRQPTEPPMTPETQALLEALERLAPGQKRAFAREVLRRAPVGARAADRRRGPRRDGRLHGRAGRDNPACGTGSAAGPTLGRPPPRPLPSRVLGGGQSPGAAPSPVMEVIFLAGAPSRPPGGLRALGKRLGRPRGAVFRELT